MALLVGGGIEMVGSPGSGGGGGGVTSPSMGGAAAHDKRKSMRRQDTKLKVKCPTHTLMVFQIISLILVLNILYRWKYYKQHKLNELINNKRNLLI
jgi:hypothetical protein